MLAIEFHNVKCADVAVNEIIEIDKRRFSTS